MDFIVLDELGYLPFAQSGGQLLFHLISQLYEQTSVMVTGSPLPFSTGTCKICKLSRNGLSAKG
jgi:DNA replication protein DnaC